MYHDVYKTGCADQKYTLHCETMVLCQLSSSWNSHHTSPYFTWKPHCHIASLTLQSPCCLLVNILQEKLCRASWASEIWINTLWVSYDRFLMSKTPVYVACVSFTNVLRVSVSCFIKYSKAVLPMVCVFLFHVIF